MKQKIACVYLIENLKNSKKYIGQTVNFHRRKGKLYIEKDSKLTTQFNGKTKTVTINKYKDLSIPLIICTFNEDVVRRQGTRICMENEVDFKSNLVKDIEYFVKNFDLKTIINIY